MVAASLAVCDRGLSLKWDAFRLFLSSASLLQYYVQHLSRWKPRSDAMYRQGWQVLPGYMWHLCSLPFTGPALPGLN